MNPQLSRREIGRILQQKGDWISKYPACSYEIYDMMRELEDTLKEIDDDGSLKATILYFLSTMDDIWFSISSAASENIPLGTQLEIIRKIGDFWKEIGESLKKGVMPHIDTILLKPLGLYEFIQKIEKMGLENGYSEEKTREKDFPDISGVRDYREKAIKCLEFYKGDLKYGVIRESLDPIFMLKSGYRSFSFFNMDRITHNPNISYLITEIIALETNRWYLLAREENKEINRLIYLEKGPGKTEACQPGVINISEKLNIPSTFLPRLTPFSSEEMVKGIQIEKGNVAIIIDDVTSTGSELKKALRRVQNMGGEVFASVIVFHRQLGELPPYENITTVFTNDTFLERRLLEPDVLKISIENPLWASLNMKIDYLHDICLYAGQEDKYDILEKGFRELIAASLGFKSSLGEDWTVLLTNIEILCWNYINKLLHGKHMSKDNAFENVVDYLDNEIEKKFVSRILVDVICKGLDREEIRDFTKLRDYLIVAQNEVLNLLNSRLEKIGLVDMEKETISKKEAEEIIEKYLSDFEEHYRKDMKKCGLGLEKLSEIKEMLRKDKMEKLKMFYEIV